LKFVSSPTARKAVLSALSERHETASLSQDNDGNPNPSCRIFESVPLAATIETFFDREIKPHMPDDRIDATKRDERMGKSDSCVNRPRWRSCADSLAVSTV
jgi:type I restriction enzyme M protein